MSFDLLIKSGSLLAAWLLTKLNAIFFIFLSGIHTVETSVCTVQLTRCLKKLSQIKVEIRRKVASSISQSCFDEYGYEDTREGTRMQALWPVV